jgi:Flp pilus assembly protein TadD
VSASRVAVWVAAATLGAAAAPALAQPREVGAMVIEIRPGRATRLDEVRFEVADRARADLVRRDLQEVEQALGSETSTASRAVVLAGVLASRGFLRDARRVVLAAILADPTQASLHALLGVLYARTGLAREADEAHEQARARLRRLDRFAAVPAAHRTRGTRAGAPPGPSDATRPTEPASFVNRPH